MKTIKKLVRKWLPPIAIDAFLCSRNAVDLWLNRKILAKNRSIAGSFAGEDCFILATGPSIAKQNLSLLKNRLCISVSNFFVHPDFNVLKPIFHCIAPYHLPITEAAWQDWMRDLRSHIDNDTSVVFGLSDFQRSDKFFEDCQRYYLYFGASENYISKNGLNLTRPLLSPRSVSIHAIQLAMGLGFSRIFLIGLDHDYISHHGDSRHFYDEAQDAKVRGGYSEWDKSLVNDIGVGFESLAILWRQYRFLRKMAEYQHVEIINLTDGGLLDVFERRDFPEFV
jgi:hypothetical protein